jgi:hypothetical protein
VLPEREACNSVSEIMTLKIAQEYCHLTIGVLWSGENLSVLFC